MLPQYFPPTFQHKIMKRINANAATSIPTTEIRVLILLCYFILLIVMLTAIVTTLAKNADNLNFSILEYLACEATGRSPTCDATKEAFQPLAAQGIWIVVIIFLGAFPGVQLLDIVARKCLRYMSGKRDTPSAPTQTELRRNV